MCVPSTFAFHQCFGYNVCSININVYYTCTCECYWVFRLSRPWLFCAVRCVVIHCSSSAPTLSIFQVQTQPKSLAYSKFIHSPNPQLILNSAPSLRIFQVHTKPQSSEYSKFILSPNPQNIPSSYSAPTLSISQVHTWDHYMLSVISEFVSWYQNKENFKVTENILVSTYILIQITDICLLMLQPQEKRCVCYTVLYQLIRSQNESSIYYNFSSTVSLCRWHKEVEIL